jgi:hypothetical protein
LDATQDYFIFVPNPRITIFNSQSNDKIFFNYYTD